MHLKLVCRCCRAFELLAVTGARAVSCLHRFEEVKELSEDAGQDLGVLNWPGASSTLFMPALQRIQDCGTTQRQGHAGDTNEASHLLMDTIPDPFVQNMFVLCHGEEVISTAVDVDAQAGARPWDPPLTARGKQQARRVGRKIKLEGWNVTRVVVSPFLRCVQTAVEVIAGLSTMPSDVHMWDRDQGWPSSASPIKASIEYGLAENLMNKQGICLSQNPRPSEVEDKQEWLQPWTLDLAELYSMLPIEIYDPSFQPIKRKLPRSRESIEDTCCRYTSTFKKIANRYLHENILYITHGEGVRQSVSMMWPRTQVNKVTYCAYTHAQRPIFEDDNGDWELITESGSSSGILLRSYT